MKKITFSQATYLLSSLTDVEPFYDPHHNPLPEIALVGKSNVGKSSLINHLLNRKNLALVSAQPGKTQTINYFNIDNQLIMVDLPGYGYARRAHDMKEKWSSSIDHYLNHRKPLRLILLLIDIRRDPSPEDLAFVEWARHHQKPVLIIFTKSDTMTPREQKEAVEVALQKLQTKSYLIYSIKDRSARDNLIKTINKTLHGLPQ